jgi:hypothetical protein
VARVAYICQCTDISVSSYVNQHILVTYFEYFDGPSDSGLNGRVRAVKPSRHDAIKCGEFLTKLETISVSKMRLEWERSFVL